MAQQTLIPISTVYEACDRARTDCLAQSGWKDLSAPFARRCMGIYRCVEDLGKMRSVGDAWFAGRIVWWVNRFREAKMPHEMNGALFLLYAMADTPGINTTFFKAHKAALKRGTGK